MASEEEEDEKWAPNYILDLYYFQLIIVFTPLDFQNLLLSQVEKSDSFRTLGCQTSKIELPTRIVNSW